ncbi:MAG: hypothetical protein ACRCXZ_07860, partial [Patescibacteria group bacterium]
FPKGRLNPHASDYIYEQMYITLKLLQDERAYVLEDGIYYDNNANQDIDRVFLPKSLGSKEYTDRDIANDQKDAEDFALWKFVESNALQKYKFEDFENLLQFNYPSQIANRWGCPGWHTECVAMIGAVLGIGSGYQPSQFSFDKLKLDPIVDIHTGGEDHIEIHHKNEILQSLSLGIKLSQYWVHNKHLKVDNQKMSKSLGNVFNVIGDEKETKFPSIVSKGINPLAFRLMFFEHDYREQINFTWEKLIQSQNRLHSLYKLGSCLNSFIQYRESKGTDLNLKKEFQSLLLENLNSREVLELFQKTLLELVSQTKTGAINQALLNTLIELDSEVLKLDVFYSPTSQELNILNKRIDAKKAKDFATSDSIRDELISQGFVIDDYTWGSSIWKK